MSQQLKVGAATRDITPQGAHWLKGYANRTRRSEGVAEPISASVLASESGGDRGLIVTIDMVGLHDTDASRLTTQLSAETGVAADQIMISCSHTHFAPSISPNWVGDATIGLIAPDAAFVEATTTRVVDCAREAVGQLRTVAPVVIRTAVPSVVYNRRVRGPDGQVTTRFRYPQDPQGQGYLFAPVDPEAVAIRFDAVDDGPVAALVNYGCHPVTGGLEEEAGHYQISADYPYYLRRELQREWHCPVLFTLGAAGDAVPLRRFGTSRAHIGAVVAGSLCLAEVLAGPQPPVRHQWGALDLAVDAPHHAEDLDKLEAAVAALQEQPPTPATDDPQDPARNAIHRAFLARLYPQPQHLVRALILELGVVTLVGLPFDVLPEMALRLKRRFPRIVIVSYANGHQGYFPFRDEFPLGGYETSPLAVHFGPGTAERLYEAIAARLSQVAP